MGKGGGIVATRAVVAGGSAIDEHADGVAAAPGQIAQAVIDSVFDGDVGAGDADSRYVEGDGVEGRTRVAVAGAGCAIGVEEVAIEIGCTKIFEKKIVASIQKCTKF